VKAVLRRCKPVKQGKSLKRDGLVLNPDEHTVTVDGERIILTYKEYELLHLFLSQPGIAFTREQLLVKVWDTEYMGETRTVDMHIRTLRQKLGNYGHIIETVRNVGYRLENKYDK
jgi:two-component system alkaline phosphatase synthesis response regulator PhoP